MKKETIKLKKFFFTLFIGLILTQCTSENIEEIRIIDPFLFKPFEGATMTAGYMKISNLTDKLFTIDGLDCSPIVAEMHDVSTNSDGLMKMGKLDSFKLSPNTTVSFEPGGKHVMAWGLKEGYSENVICNLLIKESQPVSFKFFLKERE